MRLLKWETSQVKRGWRDGEVTMKKLRHTKAMHGRLLRSGALFTSPHLHSNLFLSYAASHHEHSHLLPNLLLSMPTSDPLPWNALLARLSHFALPFHAIRTFSAMHRSPALVFDSFSLCSSFTAAASARTVGFGAQVHGHVVKCGWMGSVYVSGAMLDFYAKLGRVHHSKKVFDEIPVKNVVCVNTLLSGLADAGLWCQVLELYHEMYHVLGLGPDSFTFSALLRVCAGLSAVELGKQVHAALIRRRIQLPPDAFLLSSLIEMYGKCGLVDDARKVFEYEANIEGTTVYYQSDVVLWTSLLSAYGRNGRFLDVIQVFDMMLKSNVRPDKVAFVAVLSACGHTGHVTRGVQYFESMARDFGVIRGVEHYGCLVDMLCRAGELGKAWEVVNQMPVGEDDLSGSIAAWGTLLNACEAVGNVELGRLAAERALKLQPENDGIYVMLSNLYAKCGMWSEIEELRKWMEQRGLRKDIGCSWIESSA